MAEVYHLSNSSDFAEVLLTREIKMSMVNKLILHTFFTASLMLEIET
jgi:hypothetical protein